MTSVQDESSAPTIRFKRRKTAHPKRLRADQDAAVFPSSSTPVADTPIDTHSPPEDARTEADSVPKLKEILRNRKRPRDRVKEVARKAEPTKTELMPVDAPQQHPYTSRFVAQTGQVVDRDDKQMTVYVEARLAEQNHRQYGWPIPSHLQATVVEIAPDIKHNLAASSSVQLQSGSAARPADIEHSIRLAAGMGRIQEVEPGPDPTQRTHHKWRRLENGEFEQVSTGKVRLGRGGKPRRPPKRRNSEDIKRDQMVEAVLREAKLDYFDAHAPINSHAPGAGNNDEALLQRFQAEYYESIEEARQQQRKPAPPVKGAPEAPKGPKLGGSKSARAKMHKLQQEQLAKTKR